MPSSAQQSPDEGPLTAEQKQELEEASQRARALTRAGKVAAFSGWTVGFFAAVTLLFGLTSPVALLLGAGMGVVAWNEFRGRDLLRRLDAAGPELLAKNQLGFMALIILYCCWSIYWTLFGPPLNLSALEMFLEGIEDLVRTLAVMVYGIVIVATIVFQGLMARYYRGRGRILEGYLRDTPDWVVDLQRSAAVD
jgi:hypothetical protein